MFRRCTSVVAAVTALVVVSSMVALADAGSAAPKTYSIDPVHSTAIFRIKHMGAGPFYGRFNDVSGTIAFDGSESLELDVSVAIESVDSGSERLDGHLKSPDFFNAKEFPTMTFKSRSVKNKAHKLSVVAGDLTIHGVTKPMTVEVEWIGTADMGRGERCGFEAIFTIKRSDFGMTMGVEAGSLGDDIRVIVGLEAGADE